MARTVKNPKLDTRSARSKLAARKSAYWTPISPGFALGYRKGAKGGVWVAKIVRPGLRRETRIGPADDVLDADGAAALSFAQAQERARQWFSAVVRAQDENAEDEESKSYTIAQAAADYLAWFQAHRKSIRETQYAIDAFVLPKLGRQRATDLTPAKIRFWHHEVAKAPARLRTKRGQIQRFRAPSDDPEDQRRRRATANRILTVLKALLNHAWREGKIGSDNAWRRVQPFRQADAARVQYLTRDECVRLVNACSPEFRPLVQGALYTGCRYGELARMSAADFNSDAGTVQVREAKSGIPRHVWLTEDGANFFAALVAGLSGDSPLFSKARGGRWRRSHQVRPLKDACVHAKIEPPASFHVLRHTYASHLVMGGVPLAAVAGNLGHTDTRMVEKHYAHLSPSWLAEAIRAVPSTIAGMKPADAGNVAVLRPKQTGARRPIKRARRTDIGKVT